MKLYSLTPSAYSQMARIVRIEKGLTERIELVSVTTRGVDNPLYSINPSGRVPVLVLDDGTILEGSPLVCWYMDHLDGNPTLHPPEGMAGLEHRRIEAMARAWVDGVAVWAREFRYREAENSMSEATLEHESGRSRRLADIFEKEVQGKVLSGPWNMAQITLAGVFSFLPLVKDKRGFRWQDGRPNLRAWIERMHGYPSIAHTLPPLE
jgi:glutathione S-transferase